MTPNIRTCIAYVSGCLISGKSCSTIKDAALGSVLPLNSLFKNGNIDVDDQINGSTIMGMWMDGHATFTISPSNVSVTLQISGSDFKGSESSSKRTFNGSVAGSTVKLYDYDDGKFFYFELTD